MKKRLVSLIFLAISCVWFLTACEDDTSTGGYSGQRPILEQLSGDYVGQILTRPTWEETVQYTGVEYPWYLTGDKEVEYRKKAEELIVRKEDSFSILKAKKPRTGEDGYMVKGVNGGANYYIIPYSEGDTMSYMNETQSMVNGVYDLVNDAGAKFGNLSYSTHSDEKGKDAFMVNIDLVVSPSDFETETVTNIAGETYEVKNWKWRFEGCYFMKGHRPVLEGEKWDYWNKVFDQLGQ